MGLTVSGLVYMDAPTFRYKYLWKLRERNAPSAPSSSRYIKLHIFYDGDQMPTRVIWRDPLLRSIFIMKARWTYGIEVGEGGATGNLTLYPDEKAALEAYKKECKDFPRSKEVDYGFPVVDQEEGA